MFFDNHLHRSTDGDSNFCPVDESAKLPKLSKSSATRLNLSPHVGTHTSVNKQEILFEETSSTPSDSAAYPRALLLSDETLISMLSLPPKTVPQMRTKSSFQDFFRGIPEERMKRLLHRAYGNLNDLEREVKVKKRMELLAGVLTNV